MKKILASILTIAMLMTTLSAAVIPASAATDVATNGFTEDFEEYATEINWLANMTEVNIGTEEKPTMVPVVDSTKISGMGANAWTIYAGKSTTKYTVADVVAKNASMEVVEDPKNPDNKVLKLDAGDMESNEFFYFRRNSNEGKALKHTELEGKKMVIKAKFMLPASYSATGDTAMLAYDRQAGHPGRFYYGQHGANYSSRNWTILAAGSYNYGWNVNASSRASAKTDDWFDLKFVFDIGTPSEDHPADTYRGFYDGSIYTFSYPAAVEGKIKEVNSKFPQPGMVAGETGEKVVESWGGYTYEPTNTVFKSFEDFYGTSMSVTGKTGSTTDYLYMDDLMVYYIDPFKQEGAATFEKTENGVWYAGEITIPFNNDLMTVVKENGTTLDYKSLFTLKDAEGNVVENGITSAKAEGKNLIIEVSKEIPRNVSYTISASPLFMDAEGQGLNQFSDEQDILTFATAEDPYAHIIYDFDFDSYTIDDKDWIDNVDSNRYVTVDGVEEGTITINKHSSASANQEIKVVKDPAGGDNQVLALKAGHEGNGYVTHIRFNANGKTGISRSDMGKGKKLVYKTKIFIPEDFQMTESAQLVNMKSENQTQANGTSGIGATMNAGFYVATTGGWNYPMARGLASLSQTSYGSHAIGGKWVEWKHVADVSKPLSATHSDTVRAYVDGKLSTATLANSGDGFSHGTNDKYNVASGTTLIDFVPGGSPLYGSTNYASLGATWWGSHFTINPQTNTSKSDTFYLDDVEAFWIDALTFNAVNAENFEGGKVKFNFNQKIRDNVEYYSGNYASWNYKTIALDKMFKIVDPETKEEVVGGIAAVALSADGKTVSITPDASLEKGGDYQIEISPFLVDEYGQGLENNSTATYVDLHISETFTPFELISMSQTEISGFTQGRDVKVTATFSVAVDDESITNGIVVTDSEGNEVARNEGWTAEFGKDEDGNTDYKVIVFDFGSLPTADYTVAIDEDFLATNGAELASSFGITINKANDAIVLFEEDFDDYATGNWIDAANEVTDGSLYSGNPNTWTKAYYKSYTVNNRDWDVQQHWTTSAVNTAPDSLETDDFVGIAAAPDAASGTGMTGNVLKLSNTRGTAYNANYVAIRRNFDKGNSIDLLNGEYAGKKLVYEADVYAAVGRGDTAFMAPALAQKYVHSYADTATWKLSYQTTVMRSSGTWKSSFASYGPIAMYSQVTTPDNATKAPVKFKMVISKGENVDSIAIYSNGKLLQRPADKQAVLKGHEYNDSARHEFLPIEGGSTASLKANDTLYGVYFSATAYNKGSSEYYIDNLKAYLVDEFTVESVEGAGNVFNTAKGAVTYTFSKPVDSASVIENDTIVLLDAEGNAVTGGIASATLSDADYKLTVKLSETLAGKTKYTIKLTEGLRDADGLTLSTEWKYYEYPIDQFYTGADNVYSITDIAGTATLDCTYTPATDSAPAYLDYKGNKTVVDTWVRDAEAMKLLVDVTTSKSTSLSAEASDATVNGTTVSTNVVFTNPETTDMSVWCVVAAFGEYNEMLGCKAIEYTVAASESSESIPVSFEAKNEGIKFVKMFVWDSYEDMTPYQKAETLIAQ